MSIRRFFNADATPARDIKKISKPWYAVLIAMFVVSLVLAINQLFSLRIFGFMPIGNAYSYYLIGIFLGAMFIIHPASERSAGKVPWFDIVLCLLSFASCLYFAYHALDIIQLGWELTAPPIPTMFSFVLWLLVLEGARRTAGIVLSGVCLFFSFFPLFCDKYTGIFSGIGFTLVETARNHAMSTDAILGVAFSSLGTTLIGFLLFGVVLSNTGGGDFFLDLAQGMMGHKAGGPAKVAVLSSALFGSISGSAVANVVTTGSITIPLMKKTGISPEYAGAIEACASTGGTIAPPVMGAAAFIMASFMGVSYSSVVVAAVIPSLLFYIGLFFQIDFYSQKSGLKGLPKEGLPNLKSTFKKGWYFIFGIAVLVYFLFVERVDSWAPFYASLTLIMLSMISKETRLNIEKLVDIVYNYGLTVGRIVALLGSVGLIIGALSRTGVALSFSRELVVITDNVLTILVTGAIASFILGMGMVSVAVYIFLAIVMVPALTALGINAYAAHFFVLYWGVVSFITPPVALASYTASGIAKSNPLKTGLLAMRLGTMLYVIPFFFVYNPVLLAQGKPLEIAYNFLLALLGIYFIASAYEGYFKWIGVLPIITRFLFLFGGMLVLLPEMITDVVGIVLIVATITVTNLIRKEKSASTGA